MAYEILGFSIGGNPLSLDVWPPVIGKDWMDGRSIFIKGWKDNLNLIRFCEHSNLLHVLI